LGEVGFGPVEGGLEPGGESGREMDDAAVDGFEGEFGRLVEGRVVENQDFVDPALRRIQCGREIDETTFVDRRRVDSPAEWPPSRARFTTRARWS